MTTVNAVTNRRKVPSSRRSVRLRRETILRRRPPPLSLGPDGVSPARIRGMEHRRLGNSDFDVSVIALGSWLTYSGGVGREQTEACTRAAFDAGITFFDTANVYGRGAAERAWGEILGDYPRDSYTLA